MSGSIMDNPYAAPPDGSGFPRFREGDVFVTITNRRMYQLHAVHLCRYSPIFRAVLTERNAAPLTPKKGERNGPIRWRIDLDTSENDMPGRFVLQTITDRDGPLYIPEAENGLVPRAIYKHYNDLFRAWYRLTPDFDHTSWDALLADCSGLMSLADNHDSSRFVAPHINRALQAWRSSLYSAVSEHPVIWSNVGMQLKSRAILREAIVHLVGQWNSLSSAERGRIHADVLNICTRKCDELDLKKKVLEAKIASYYPWQLANGPASSSFLSSARQSGIYLWQAVALFRHWFSMALSTPCGRNSRDGGAEFYRMIGRGGFSYLERSSIAAFLDHFNISGRRLNAFDEALSAIKEEIRPYVNEMLVNRSRVDSNTRFYRYLTCCEVRRRDMPWESDDASDREDDFHDDDHQTRLSPSPDRTISEPDESKKDEEESSEEEDDDEDEDEDEEESSDDDDDEDDDDEEDEETSEAETTESEDWNDGRYAKKGTKRAGNAKSPTQKPKTPAATIPQKRKAPTPKQRKTSAPKPKESSPPKTIRRRLAPATKVEKAPAPKQPKAPSPKMPKMGTFSHPTTPTAAEKGKGKGKGKEKAPTPKLPKMGIFKHTTTPTATAKKENGKGKEKEKDEAPPAKKRKVTFAEEAGNEEMMDQD
ncbi:MAG: hypothetical protein M1823_004151 [Watsoniomyces obsoletus]|nr:MAG: hypothetical protein M1823_004151 [Watsoniomyces obsoletus]